MSITRDEVRRVARLARLRFSDDEEERLADQMSRILDYMNQLNELDTSGVPPMSHVLDEANVFRSDEPEQRINAEQALRQSADADDKYFRVPRVID